MTQETEFVTITEAARRSGLAACYLRKRARAGSIPIIRVGAKFLIAYSLLVEQLQREAQGGEENEN